MSIRTVGAVVMAFKPKATYPLQNVPECSPL